MLSQSSKCIVIQCTAYTIYFPKFVCLKSKQEIAFKTLVDLVNCADNDQTSCLSSLIMGIHLMLNYFCPHTLVFFFFD